MDVIGRELENFRLSWQISEKKLPILQQCLRQALAKLALGPLIGNAKHQFGNLICGGIVRDFHGRFI